MLDSYGLKLQNNDCGAIYQQIVPAHNVCKPPLQWQTYDVTFHKAVKEGDKVIEKARITVVHNGVTTIEDKEIAPNPRRARAMPRARTGRSCLQDHGNLVQYRNMWIKPLTK